MKNKVFEKITAEIKKVNMVLDNNLKIPNYQRPYRWTEDNVRLLLEDITNSWKEGKSSYRVGSVILNNSATELNIVDGQQVTFKNSYNMKVAGNLFAPKNFLAFALTSFSVSQPKN